MMKSHCCSIPLLPIGTKDSLSHQVCHMSPSSRAWSGNRPSVGPNRILNVFSTTIHLSLFVKRTQSLFNANCAEISLKPGTNPGQNRSRPCRSSADSTTHQVARTKKSPGNAGAFGSLSRLFWTNIRCLLALRASGHFKGDALIFLERLETARLNCGEVRKQIFATLVRGDEAKTLRIIEPLYDTSCHTISYFS